MADQLLTLFSKVAFRAWIGGMVGATLLLVYSHWLTANGQPWPDRLLVAVSPVPIGIWYGTIFGCPIAAVAMLLLDPPVNKLIQMAPSSWHGELHALGSMLFGGIVGGMIGALTESRPFLSVGGSFLVAGAVGGLASSLVSNIRPSSRSKADFPSQRRGTE